MNNFKKIIFLCFNIVLSANVVNAMAGKGINIIRDGRGNSVRIKVERPGDKVLNIKLPEDFRTYSANIFHSLHGNLLFVTGSRNTLNDKHYPAVNTFILCFDFAGQKIGEELISKKVEYRYLKYPCPTFIENEFRFVVFVKGATLIVIKVKNDDGPCFLIHKADIYGDESSGEYIDSSSIRIDCNTLYFDLISRIRTYESVRFERNKRTLLLKDI